MKQGASTIDVQVEAELADFQAEVDVFPRGIALLPDAAYEVFITVDEPRFPYALEHLKFNKQEASRHYADFHYGVLWDRLPRGRTERENESESVFRFHFGHD